MPTPNRIKWLRQKRKEGKTLSNKELAELDGYESKGKRKSTQPPPSTTDGEKGTEGGGVRVETDFPDLGGGAFGSAPPPINIGESEEKPETETEEKDGAESKSPPNSEAREKAKHAAIDQIAGMLGGVVAAVLKKVNDDIEKDGGFAPLNMVSKFAGDAFGAVAELGVKIDGDFIYQLNAGSVAFLVKDWLAEKDLDPKSYAAAVVVTSGASTGAAYIYNRRRLKKEQAHGRPTGQTESTRNEPPIPIVPPAPISRSGATGASAFGKTD